MSDTPETPRRSKKMTDTPTPQEPAGSGLPRHALLSVARRCGDIVTEGHPDDDDLWIPAHEIVKNGCCDWQQEEDGQWETDCRKIFEFTVGGPSDNGFKFCPYCGKLLTWTPFLPDNA